MSLVLFFPVSAETDIGWDEELSNTVNSHLKASCLGNVCSKNCWIQLNFLQVTNKNVWDVFWDTV